ncbi:MAG TPA: hypothetical protein VEJ21_07035, partial [Acidimicrobiales bacterium]|nr:hypothetical protein [Acidimicrobiales bacterium]
RQWWQVTFDTPRTADTVTLLQPQNGRHNQWITAVTLRFDGTSALRVPLGPQSRRLPGQVIHFPARSFRTLRVTIDATNFTPARALEGGISAVGLAEVGVDGVQATEHVVMPSDLLHAAGARSLADRLLVVMTRLRVAPATSRTDPEDALVRTLWLPTARTFDLTGTARIDAAAPDQLVDALVGRTSGSGVTAYSSGRLQGDVADTASAALDGDPGTIWSSPLGAGEQIGQSITVQLPGPVTLHQLHMDVVVDGRHSVPSLLRVSAGSTSAVVALPELPRQDRPDGTDPVSVSFAPLTGSTIRLTVLGIRPLRAVNYYAGGDVTLPVALADIQIPGGQMPMAPAAIPSPCRSELLSIDGSAVPLRISGTSATALQGADGVGLAVSLCGADTVGLRLGPGTHQIVATPGLVTGLDLDQLVLDSAPGGGAPTGDGPAGVAAAPTPPAPVVRLVHAATTTVTAKLTVPFAAQSSPPRQGPFWLVLGESVNSGWQATVVGGPSLGRPELIDGFANGWLVYPGDLSGRRSVEIDLRWAPQRGVDVAFVISAVAGAACLVVLVWPRRRRRVLPSAVAGPEPATEGPDPGAPELDLSNVTASPAPAPQQLSRARLLLASLGAGVLAAVVVAPLAGVAVALGVAACCLARGGRFVLAVGTVSAMLATALTMVVVEAVGGYPADGQWTAHFEAAAVLTWMALVLAVAETLVRRGRRPPQDASDVRRAAPGASPPPSPPN